LKHKQAIIGDDAKESVSPDRKRLVSEVLVARHTTPFVLPDFMPDAQAEYEQRLREGFYNNLDTPTTRDEEISRLRGKYEARWRIIPPTEQRRFEFRNILCRRSPEEHLQLRYRTEVLDYPPDEVFRSLWIAGDPDKGAAQYWLMPRHLCGKYQVLRVPTDCVAPDGTLTVHFINRNPYANPLWFEDPEPEFHNTLEITRYGVQCLFTVGSFEGNLARLFVLMLCKLMFLAALAVLMTSIFSFPVACLTSFVVYALAALRSFISESLEFLDKSDEPVLSTIGRFIRELFNGTMAQASKTFETIAMDLISSSLHVVFKVVPDFTYFDGVETLVNGENVSLVWVLQGVGTLALLQGGILLGLATILFYRREVSETSF